MTPKHVKAALDVLCGFYGDREGNPRRLNAVQILVYGDGLSRFNEEQLESACRAWMQQSQFFPALSDLLRLLEPPVDMAAAAHLAWTTVERAIRQAGIYRGAEFVNGAVGETARQVFGSWRSACSYDLDSPGWAIKRQTFLALFPSIAARHDGSPVALQGIHEGAPMRIGPVAGLPQGRPASSAPQPLSHREAVSALDAIKQRAIAAGKVQP